MKPSQVIRGKTALDFDFDIAFSEEEKTAQIRCSWMLLPALQASNRLWPYEINLAAPKRLQTLSHL